MRKPRPLFRLPSKYMIPILVPGAIYHIYGVKEHNADGQIIERLAPNNALQYTSHLPGLPRALLQGIHIFIPLGEITRGEPFVCFEDALIYGVRIEQVTL